MHPSPRSVCSGWSEGPVLPCVDLSGPQISPTVCVQRTGISVQGPALRAVPIAPCLHESSGGSPCSLERKGRVHSQLPRRLAHSGSVSGSVMRTQGFGALAPQPVGPLGQLEKEQTLPDAEDLFSRYGVGLGQSDSAPHAGTFSVSVELLEYVQEQDGGTTQTVSEAPRAYGSCGGSHVCVYCCSIWDRFNTDSTVPRWAWQRGTLRVWVTPACRHIFTPWSDLSFLRAEVPLEQVSRQAVVYTDASVKGWGDYVQQTCSVGGLDGSPTALAHQLPRVAGSTPGLELSQEALMGDAGSGPHGQHCDRYVHQTTRWSTLQSHVVTRTPPPPLESEASEVALRHSHSGLAQPGSQRAVTSCAARRAETPSPDGPADLETFRTRTGRPVRVPRDFSLSVVLLPDRGNTRHGRAGTQLAVGPLQVCISPSEPSRTDTVQDQGRRGADPARGAILAHSDLVPAAPPWQIPLRKDLLRDGAPCGTHVQTSGNFMSGPLKGRGGSRWPTPRGSRQHHFGGSAVYETCLRLEMEPDRRMVLFSQRRPPEVPDQSRAVLLAASVGAKAVSLHPQSLRRLRLLPTTSLWKGSRVGKHDWVIRFLRGAGWILHPPPSIPSWVLSLVLTALQQGLFEPLQTVEPKFQRKRKILLLLALASIKRVGTCTHFGRRFVPRVWTGGFPDNPEAPARLCAQGSHYSLQVARNLWYWYAKKWTLAYIWYMRVWHTYTVIRSFIWMHIIRN